MEYSSHEEADHGGHEEDIDQYVTKKLKKSNEQAKGPKESGFKRPKVGKREFKEDASKVTKKERLQQYMASQGYNEEDLEDFYGLEEGGGDGHSEMFGKPADQLTYEEAMQELMTLQNGMGGGSDSDELDSSSSEGESGEEGDTNAKQLAKYLKKYGLNQEDFDDNEMGGEIMQEMKPKEKKQSKRSL